MDPQEITTGFSFTHPTQGNCTVVGIGRKGHARYAFGTPGWPAQHAVTTPQAIAKLIDTGVLSRLA